MSRKDAILQTATHLFSQKGYANTSMSEVSEVTGVAGSTIFYHFKTKEDLFLAVLKGIKNGITEAFRQYRGNRKFDTGLDMTVDAVAFYLHQASVTDDWFLLLHRHYPYALAVVNPECRQLLEEIYTCIVDIFETPIRIGQQDGSVAPVRSRKAALILFSMVDGLARLNTHKLYDAGALFEDLIDACRRMLQNTESNTKLAIETS